MKEQDKKLFDERFSIFWKKLNKKKKLNDEKKSAFEKKMFSHFTELNKTLDVEYSLYYVFNVPFLIMNYYERNQLRRSKDYNPKNFLDVIKYFLENDVAEYKACRYIYEKNSPRQFSEESNFKNTFRKWCKNSWNQELYPEISEYLRVMKERKMFRKSPIKNFQIQKFKKPET